MKKFKFNLESVHSVRELREEQEQTAFARLQREVLDTENRLDSLNELRLAAMNNYLSSMKGGKALDPVEMELHSNHIASLERLKLKTESELEEKRAACRKQAIELSEAARDVKVTGKLREKKKALHDQEFAKQEQTSLDEITSAKYARNAGETNQ